MIFDTLCDYALQAIDENDFTLTHYEMGEFFTSVTLTSNDKEFVGVTLTPSDEGNLTLPNYHHPKQIVSNCGYDLAKRAFGLACINAVGQFLQKNHYTLEENLRQSLGQLILENSDVRSHIVFIGDLKPVVAKVKQKRKNVEVFCRRQNDADAGVYSDIFEYEALAKCDIAIITGASLIGSTIDAMLKFCNAKMIVLAGFSAGGYHQWFKDTPITHLASLTTQGINMQRCQTKMENIFKQKSYIQEIQ